MCASPMQKESLHFSSLPSPHIRMSLQTTTIGAMAVGLVGVALAVAGHNASYTAHKPCHPREDRLPWLSSMKLALAVMLAIPISCFLLLPYLLLCSRYGRLSQSFHNTILHCRCIKGGTPKS